MAPYESMVVITGGQTGLGFEAARIIAKENPKSLIVIASRSSGQAAVNDINAATRTQNVKYIRLDLADLENVRRFAAEIIDHKLPVSALVMNAGLQQLNLSYTTDGIETTFGVNHVGHALLFHLLMHHLTSNARVVITSSGTHDPKQKTGIPDAKYTTAELLAHPSDESKKDHGQQRYSTSKLCNVLWLYALERHRQERNLSFTVNAMDPGLMPGTGLAREQGGIAKFVWNQILPRIIPLLRLLLFPNIHTPQESGSALARLAISNEVDQVSGKYFEGLNAIQSSTASYDEEDQADLWDWTSKFVAMDGTEAQAFRELA